MAIKQRRIVQGIVIGVAIALITAILLILTIRKTLWLIMWLMAHRAYIPFTIILAIYAISLVSFVFFLSIVTTRYLPHASPSLLKRVLLIDLILMGLLSIILPTYFVNVELSEYILVGVGILPPSIKSPVPLIVNVTLEEYVLLNCHGMNISNLGNLNETASILSALPQSLAILFLGVIILVIVAGLWPLTIPLLKSILEYSSGGKEGVYNALCHGDRWLLYLYMAATLITYFMGFSIIIYSLAILSSSEFPYAYAMLVTTFLVLIVEALMMHDSRDGSQWLWVALLISVVSSLIYTVVAFYINGFILPSTCLAGVNDVLGMYEFLLLLAGIFGAIPYVSTLSIIHYRIMCPQVKAEETSHRSVEEHGSSEMANSSKRATRLRNYSSYVV